MAIITMSQHLISPFSWKNQNCQIANTLQWENQSLFTEFLENLVVSLNDVRRVLFGGNDAPFIRNPCKLPFSTAPRENKGVAVQKRRSKYTHLKAGARRELRNFGRTGLWKYANIMNRPWCKSIYSYMYL